MAQDGQISSEQSFASAADARCVRHPQPRIVTLTSRSLPKTYSPQVKVPRIPRGPPCLSLPAIIMLLDKGMRSLTNRCNRGRTPHDSPRFARLSSPISTRLRRMRQCAQGFYGGSGKTTCGGVLWGTEGRARPGSLIRHARATRMYTCFIVGTVVRTSFDRARWIHEPALLTPNTLGGKSR